MPIETSKDEIRDLFMVLTLEESVSYCLYPLDLVQKISTVARIRSNRVISMSTGTLEENCCYPRTGVSRIMGGTQETPHDSLDPRLKR